MDEFIELTDFCDNSPILIRKEDIESICIDYAYADMQTQKMRQ